MKFWSISLRHFHPTPSTRRHISTSSMLYVIGECAYQHDKDLPSDFTHNPLPMNLVRPRQDGRHFADDIFMCIFFNENCCILIKFSLKYVRKGPIDNNPALVQIMAWRRSGDKPLSEPMMVSLLTHICVTRPQWVNRGSEQCFIPHCSAVRIRI